MKHIIGVTTTKPSSSLTPGGGGGCLTLLDPKTGAVLSSLRSSADLSGRTELGISSISSFPQEFATAHGSGDLTQPVIAYGGNSVKKGDNYGMLLSIRSASSPPIMHWKCRLPETEMTGCLLVSPCGYYIAGGGTSGSVYVWSSMGGQLLRTIKAHYRSCTSLAWSDCGRYLVTGGADGMVHMFSLMDLVDVTTNTRNNSKRNVPPIHTFSVHHFPVTSLTQLTGGRIASAAEDGQVIVMELFSRQVIVNIQFPHGIQCLEQYDSRIYAGSIHGTIYSVDLNAYAMHQTEKQGAIYANNKRRRASQEQAGNSWTIEETVFGRKHSDSNNTNTSDSSDGIANSTPVYQTDWVGHDHAVTSIALLTDSEPRKMISGDSFGQVRIWDIESRTCMNVIQPWSHGAGALDSNNKVISGHPVTSIHLIPQPDVTVSSGMFDSASTGSSNHKNLSNFATLVTPLEKYVSDAATSTSSIVAGTVRVPFLKRNRTEENMMYWEAQPIVRKRQQQQRRGESKNNSTKATVTDEDDNNSEQQQQEPEQVSLMSEQIKKLQDQLKTKDTEVNRWKEVNNKLMLKLQAK